MKQPTQPIINSRWVVIKAMARLPYDTAEQRDELLKQAKDWDEHLDDEQHQAVYFYRFKTPLARGVLSGEAANAKK